MTKTLKKIIVSISLLLITSLLSVKEIRAEEVKKDQQAAKPKTSNQEKVKYSKQQKDAVIQKIQNKQNLSLEEQKIRIEILKEQYPIDWYQEMFGFKTSVMDGWCDGDLVADTLKCYPYKIIEHLTTQQIKSLILNLDDHWDDYRLQKMVKIVLTIVNEISGKQGFDAKNSSKEKDKLIVADGLNGSYPLEKISKDDLKKKYKNIYEAYNKKDEYCVNKIEKSNVAFGDKCLPFLLSEIYELAKNKLILQYWGCTLEELKDKCPVEYQFSTD
jgi:hypothetical protein